MKDFMSPAPRWAQRIASVFGIVVSPVCVVLAVNQLLHPGTESRVTDVIVFLLTIVVFATFVAGFNALWLGGKP